ncbi:polymorphic toxin-type HINT domain-containing protein [Streptomyces sp. NPDC093065]|uniref:polymorphic toxin-type HINT domain-containing protein n=1 Tax=Streptomyces sp. NPDC093065 TaxID=3366021 RepID=UPI003804E69D
MLPRRTICCSRCPSSSVSPRTRTGSATAPPTVGKKVLATDPETGKTEGRSVLATIITKDDKDFTELTIGTPRKTVGVIVATDHHPFWSPSEHTWVDAGDLKPGMTLRTDQGTTVPVHETRSFHQQWVCQTSGVTRVVGVTGGPPSGGRRR